MNTSALNKQDPSACQDECARTERVKGMQLLLAVTALSAALVLILQAAIWIASA